MSTYVKKQRKKTSLTSGVECSGNKKKKKRERDKCLGEQTLMSKIAGLYSTPVSAWIGKATPQPALLGKENIPAESNRSSRDLRFPNNREICVKA